MEPRASKMLQRAARTLIGWGGPLGAPLGAPLCKAPLGGPRALDGFRRFYMGPRRGSSSSSSSSGSFNSNSSSSSSSSSSSLPAASFSIFSTTSMVTVRPSPPTLDSVSSGGPSGGPQGPPQTFLREGGVIFSFLPKLASNKTFDKAARITVLLKARHIGHLLLPQGGPLKGGPQQPGGPLEGEEEWELEAPCGAGYSLRVTAHSTQPQTHVCIALLQQQIEPPQQQQQQQQQQQRKKKVVHLVACSRGEWLTLQLLLQQSVSLLFNWTPGALQAAAEEEARANNPQAY
ncbi:hypothetical protein Emed_005847 [Eimeria media]